MFQRAIARVMVFFFLLGKAIRPKNPGSLSLIRRRANGGRIVDGERDRRLPASTASTDLIFYLASPVMVPALIAVTCKAHRRGQRVISAVSGGASIVAVASLANRPTLRLWVIRKSVASMNCGEKNPGSVALRSDDGTI